LRREGDKRTNQSVILLLKIGKDGFKKYDIIPVKTNKDFTEFPLFYLEEAVEGADCPGLLVDHREFKEINLPEPLKKMQGSPIINTTGIWLSNE